jgi:hypothetical protein
MHISHIWDTEVSVYDELANYVNDLNLFAALPFLGNTQVFLWYPVILVCVSWIFSAILVILGLRINCTRIVMAFHFG